LTGGVVIAVAVKEKVTEKRKRKKEVGRSDTSRKEMNCSFLCFVIIVLL
jgi:hypothetical protein